MSKAFPVANDVFLKSGDAEYAFRLKPLPAGRFAKAKTVAVTINGADFLAPTTNSKGWTPDESILYYLWITLPDGRTGWITSDYGVPFVAGAAFTVVEGQTTRKDPERVLLSGDDSPETRRLKGFKAAWEAKKLAAPVAAEGEETPEITSELAEVVEVTDEAEQPTKKKGGKRK
jgi:hypothetical protein